MNTLIQILNENRPVDFFGRIPVSADEAKSLRKEGFPWKRFHRFSPGDTGWVNRNEGDGELAITLMGDWDINNVRYDIGVFSV